MPSGLCSLCGNHKELCDSHAIPDSFFTKILRKNNGKAIAIVDDRLSPISYTSDSWSDCLLCFDCEQHISNTYEGKSVQILRGKLCTAKRHSQSITLKNISKNFNTSWLKLFFCSVLWRSALSSHSSYTKIALTPRLLEILRHAILNKTEVKERDFTVLISRIIDRTRDGFAFEELKNVIISPFYRKHPGTKQLSFCYLFEGFFVEIFTPGLRHKELERLGIIRNNKQELFIPLLDVFDIQEFVALAVSGYRKSVEGLSKVREN